MGEGRPAPVCSTDQLLSLVLDELQGLRSDLAGRGGAASPDDQGRVELREPERPKRPSKRDR